MTTPDYHKPEPESARSIFEGWMMELGVTFHVDEDGCYVFLIGGATVTVSLQNIARDYERDGDPETVRRFANRIVFYPEEVTPSWEAVEPFVRFQLEPDDCACLLDGTLHTRVDDHLVKVFVYTPEDGSKITWISDDNVAGWGVSIDHVIATAEKNMRKIAAESTIELKEFDGFTLGVIRTEEHPFKASILLADNFRKLVEPDLGFPVYAIAPCRDFVFLISHADKGFLKRLGGVVRKEYQESGYSVTMDVLEVTEEGVSSFATFRPKNTDEI